MKNLNRFGALIVSVGAGILIGTGLNFHNSNTTVHADQTLFSTSFETDENQTFPENDLNSRLGSSNLSNTFAPEIDGDLTNQVDQDSIKGSKDFNDSETKQNLFDSDLSTKFLSNEDQGKGIWVSFSLEKAQKIGVYALGCTWIR